MMDEPGGSNPISSSEIFDTYYYIGPEVTLDNSICLWLSVNFEKDALSIIGIGIVTNRNVFVASNPRLKAQQ